MILIAVIWAMFMAFLHFSYRLGKKNFALTKTIDRKIKSLVGEGPEVRLRGERRER